MSEQPQPPDDQIANELDAFDEWLLAVGILLVAFLGVAIAVAVGMVL